MSPLAVILAGGGTGGHIYPGLAIAENLRDLVPGVHLSFICSTRPLDAAILERESFRPIPASAPALRPLRAARFVISWGPSVRACREEIRAARARAARVEVVALGGYVAAPAAQAARAQRAPLSLVNLDAVPGRASRWIARHARQVLTPGGSGPSAWVRINPLVRREALAPGPPPQCRRSLGLEPDRRTLLVLGGSLGASTINALLAALARTSPDAFADWQVLHATGGSGGDVERAYANAGIAARVLPFLHPVGPAWGAADAAVSRAGAGCVAEAWGNRVPTLFLPYPFHRDQHQRANAERLVRPGAAIIEPDLVHPDRNLPRAGAAIRALLTDPAMRARLARALQFLPPADGAAAAARAIAGIPA